MEQQNHNSDNPVTQMLWFAFPLLLGLLLSGPDAE